LNPRLRVLLLVIVIALILADNWRLACAVLLCIVALAELPLGSRDG
jgi:hypothetical protein